MAHWQLGEKDKAQVWFDKSAQWMDKASQVHAEAAELLGIEI
jgi:hypothetical protein